MIAIIRNFTLCILFFFSGLCGLLYQTVWLRLAFAQFGVITPIISIVISIFMLGLALGSWLGGKYISSLKKYIKLSAMSIYGVVECVIGIGAFVVPIFFSHGAELLLGIQGTASWSYLSASALVIAISILPWSIAMGATYPLILEFLKEFPNPKIRSFGMLYAANTAGAVIGALLTVFFLVEMFGFKATLQFAAMINFSIAFIAIFWGAFKKTHFNKTQSQKIESNVLPINESRRTWMILFATGLCSMAMEVVWIRCFSSFLGSFVYSFTLLLNFYLVSNWLGACWYRLDVASNKTLTQQKLIAAAALTACIPLLANNPQFMGWILPRTMQVPFLLSIFALISITPFSFVLGYLTPSLIDNVSQGNPNEAGKAYAINISGCILGPLLAGYLFLPWVGGANSLIIFVIPLIYFLISNKNHEYKVIQQFIIALCAVVLLFSSFSSSWEGGGKIYTVDNYHVDQIHRDYAATTIVGRDGLFKFLKVNGNEMTSLSQDTKFMAHLPLAIHAGKPKSVLIICFGMGTSFRSATTWDSKTTVVELLPSVIKSFNYFHSDANYVLANPNNHVIIDDGRRFLKRVTEKFDVVIVDPPPPLETSASSLLYSKEFFDDVKQHLVPGGILMEWYGFPNAEPDCLHALMRSIMEKFHYVRVFKALKEPLIGGYFILCSEQPIHSLTSDEFIAALPKKAKQDLVEWIHPENRMRQLKGQIDEILSNEYHPDDFLVPESSIVITDDHPFNEYYLLRRYFKKNMYFNQNVN